MRPSFVQKAAVLSIHPKFADAILRGTKRVELRKTPFPKDISNVIMYATSPIRYFVGRFDVDNIAVDSPDMVYIMTEGKTGIDRDDFVAYYEGKKWAVAISIRNACEFKTLIAPEKYIRNWTPPQNFRYITLNEYDRIVAAGSKPAGGIVPPRISPSTGAGPGRGSDSPPSPPGSLSRKEVPGPDTQCPSCGEFTLHYYDDGDMECHNRKCGYGEHRDGAEYKWGGASRKK